MNKKNNTQNNIVSTGDIYGFVGQNNGTVNIQNNSTTTNNFFQEISEYIQQLDENIDKIPNLDLDQVTLIRKYSEQINKELSVPTPEKKNFIDNLKNIIASIPSSVTSNIIAYGLIEKAKFLIGILSGM